MRHRRKLGVTIELAPPGTFLLEAVNFTGPCKAPVTMERAGSFKAPLKPAQFQCKDSWVKFKRLVDLTVTGIDGGGVFDGQEGTGLETERLHSKAGKCDSLPYVCLNQSYYQSKLVSNDRVTCTMAEF